ncbi:hypothetical protein J6590_063037 [Homalodisca vitripennis]|nr:hypothetical protein J6590_063037 [Homalodisca vitripennis]
MHYSGKPHDKKVTRFLFEWCAKTGAEMPRRESAYSFPRLQVPSTSHEYEKHITPARMKAANFEEYCELCEVRLTSVSDKLLHYAGKPHRKNQNNPEKAKRKKKITVQLHLSDHLGSLLNLDLSAARSPPPSVGENIASYINGFEDREQISSSLLDLSRAFDILPHSELLENNHYGLEDVELSLFSSYSSDSYDTIDLTDIRFGICTDFSTSNEAEKKLKSNGTSQEFVCELCDVKAVSEDQFQNHLSGKKHKEKMEKKNNSDSSADVSKLARPYKCYMCEVSLETSSLFKKHINGKRHLKTLSKRKMNKTGPVVALQFVAMIALLQQYKFNAPTCNHDSTPHSPSSNKFLTPALRRHDPQYFWYH